LGPICYRWQLAIARLLGKHFVINRKPARRIVHAREQLSVRFLRVDALPMSRRILEKYGFFKVSTGWAYEWSYDH
jgi:hypothetical protein